MRMSTRCFLSSAAAMLLSLADIVHGRNDSTFDRSACRKFVIDLQESPNFSLNTPEYFLQSNGRLLNSSDDMTLTVRGCNEFCGPPTFYPDALPRIMTWIVPVLLLVSNIELSPIDKKRYMTIVHALGDPIDSFWSIMHKIYIWDRLYQIGLQRSPESVYELPLQMVKPRSSLSDLGFKLITAIGLARPLFPRQTTDQDTEHKLNRESRARIIATVLSGFEEISGSQIKKELYYHLITYKCGRLGEPDEDRNKFEHWRQCARILADSRTNEYIRACLAMLVYFLGLISAFVPAIGGGSSSPPGGRIGSAIFISWLIPLALFSNRVGTYTSRRACLHTMRQFVDMTIDQDEPSRARLSKSRTMSDVTGVSTTLASSTMQMSKSNGYCYSAVPLGDDRRRRSSRGPVDDAEQWAHDIHLKLMASAHEEDDITDSKVAFHDGVNIMDTDKASAPRNRGEAAVNDQVQVFRPVNYVIPYTNSGDETGVFINHPGRIKRKPLRTDPDASSGDFKGQRRRVGLVQISSWDNYFLSLQWLGANYTYRPWKVRYMYLDPRRHIHTTNSIMALAAVFPVLLSFIAAFVIIWYAIPEGFSCRSVWPVCLFGIWILSAVITTASYAYIDGNGHGTTEEMGEGSQQQAEDAFASLRATDKTRLSEKRLWTCILIKDSIVSLACVCLVFLSTAGAFNSCYCWTLYMTKGEQGSFPLNTDEEYEVRAVRIYSGVVITCIGLQILFYLGVCWVWERGLSLGRWHEREKREEWAHEVDEHVMWRPSNQLLFWYFKDDLDAEEDNRERRASDVQMSIPSTTSPWRSIRRSF